jgi:hypothetical protein
MLGEQENLEKRVRADHLLKQFNKVLDLSSIREQVAHQYGQRSNKSIPPGTIMRMMLLHFVDNILSERELMKIIPERLD